MPHTVRLLLFLFCLSAAPRAPAADAPQPLLLGLFPYLSPARLIDLHKPLKDYLSAALGEPISLVSAADFATFRERTRRGEYHLVLTAPHLGYLAEREGRYQRVALTLNHSCAVMVALADSPIQGLADLRGKSVMLPPPTAIVHLLARKTLEEAGLRDGRDLSVRSTASHNNALLSVLQKETEAAAFGQPTWDTAAPEVKARLRVLARSQEFPGLMFMAHPGLPAAKVERLRGLLLAFQDSPEGRAYLQSSGLKGFRPIDEPDMQGVAPYAQSLLGE